MSKVRLYLAASFQRRKEVQIYSRDLCCLGFEITSRWLAEDDSHIHLPPEDCARIDEEDVRGAHVLVAFTDPLPGLPRGGRHVEFGMAKILGLRLCVVGPREHVFHHYPEVRQFDTWGNFLVSLQGCRCFSCTLRRFDEVPHVSGRCADSDCWCWVRR